MQEANFDQELKVDETLAEWGECFVDLHGLPMPRVVEASLDSDKIMTVKYERKRSLSEAELQ